MASLTSHSTSQQPWPAALTPSGLGTPSTACRQDRRRRGAALDSLGEAGTSAPIPRQLAMDLQGAGLTPSGCRDSTATGSGQGAEALSAAPEPALPAKPAAAPPDPASLGSMPAEQRLLANLLALLEEGISPWRREWDGAGGEIGRAHV